MSSADEENQFRDEALELERMLGDALLKRLPPFLREREQFEQLIDIRWKALESQRADGDSRRSTKLDGSVGALDQKLDLALQQIDASAASLSALSQTTRGLAGNVLAVENTVKRLSDASGDTDRKIEEVHRFASSNAAALGEIQKVARDDRDAPRRAGPQEPPIAKAIEALQVQLSQVLDRLQPVANAKAPRPDSTESIAKRIDGIEKQLGEILARLDEARESGGSNAGREPLPAQHPRHVAAADSSKAEESAPIVPRRPGLWEQLTHLASLASGAVVWLLAAAVVAIAAQLVVVKLEDVERKIGIAGTEPAPSPVAPASPPATAQGAQDVSSRPQGTPPDGKSTATGKDVASDNQAAATAVEGPQSLPSPPAAPPRTPHDTWRALWQGALAETVACPAKTSLQQCICPPGRPCDSADAQWDQRQAVLALQAVLKQLPAGRQVGVDGDFGTRTRIALTTLSKCSALGDQSEFGAAVERLTGDPKLDRKTLLDVFAQLRQLPQACLAR